MKTPYFIFLFIILLGRVNIGFGQSNVKNYYSKTPISNIIPPKLKDYAEFQRDLPVGSLKNVYDKLAKENLMYSYEYIFSIDRKGKIIPFKYGGGRYFEENKTLFVPVIEYITGTFNKYEWEPGYRKKCKSCKRLTNLSFTIYFETDLNKISMSIVMIDLHKSYKVYSFSIPATEQ